MTKGRHADREPAAHLPVARICVDVPLAHLDRPFDYLVPAADDEAAQPGVRVKVRFAGQLVSGYLLERAASSPHGGRLAFLDRVVSAERVLDPEVARLARAVADRYAGNLADVLRLAVPPRHARVEAQPAGAAVPGAVPGGLSGGSPGLGTAPGAVPGGLSGGSPGGEIAPGAAGGSPGGEATPGGRAARGAGLPDDAGAGWSAYPAGAAYLRGLADGRPVRAVWSALPGEDWPARIAEAAAATVRAGRGVVVVVADARDLDRLDRALTTTLGTGMHVALTAAAGPSERYRRFLAASRHRVPVVVGTRAAMFAPVAELGLVVIWDDGDDLHAEPRAPYPHAREVLLTRAQLADCAALVGGFARTGEAQLLLETGWAREIAAGRDVLRARTPRIQPTGDDPQLARDPGAATARLPSLAWQAARQALQAGAPVLVQVPRRGYLPAVACADCRTSARCPHCSGPLGLAGARAVPHCHWCGRVVADYACPACGGRRLRASVTGARRTAEELGRAFPGAPVRTSGRDGILDAVPGEPAVVVATPGAEPVAPGGYGAVLLLDTWALLTRSDLRAAEETLRRWLNAAALARADGQVIVVADGSLAPVQALLRWDPGWFAARELAERRELRFPPAARMASVTGPPAAVAELLAAARLPDGAEVLGPVPVGPGQGRAGSAPDRGGGGPDRGGGPDPSGAGPDQGGGGPGRGGGGPGRGSGWPGRGGGGPDRGGGPDPSGDAWLDRGGGDEQERMLVRVSRGRAAEMARALHEAAAVRSAKKAALPVRIQVDPADLF